MMPFRTEDILLLRHTHDQVCALLQRGVSNFGNGNKCLATNLSYLPIFQRTITLVSL